MKIPFGGRFYRVFYLFFSCDTWDFIQAKRGKVKEHLNLSIR
jgi:hypothetical protein